MSNRQARREQARQSRQSRSQRSRGGGRPSSGGGGGGFSGGGGDSLLDQLRSPFALGVIALVLVLGGIVVFLAISGSDDSDDSDAVTALEEAHEAFPADLASGVSLGAEDAPIVMEQYEDFRCSFCLNYTATQEPQLIEDYVKTGLVRLEFRNLPLLGPESLLAARGAVCAAEQDRFWDYQNTLFIRQAERGVRDSGLYTEDYLDTVADDLGLDSDAFQACLDDPATLERVTDEQSTASSLGLTGTPNFVINGQPLGAGPASYEGWRDILDPILEDLEDGDGDGDDDGDDASSDGDGTSDGDASDGATGESTSEDE